MYTIVVKFTLSGNEYHYASKFHYHKGSLIEVHTPEGYKSARIQRCFSGISPRCTKFKSGNPVTNAHYKAYPVVDSVPNMCSQKQQEFIEHINDAAQSLESARALVKRDDLRIGITDNNKLYLHGVGGLTFCPDEGVRRVTTTSFSAKDQEWVKLVAINAVETEQDIKRRALEKDMKELLEKANQIEQQLKNL